MFDPLLKHSELLRYENISLCDRLRSLNTLGFWINFVLPVIAVLLFVWYMRTEYQKRLALYNEFVPPHLNKYSEYYYKRQPIDPFTNF